MSFFTKNRNFLNSRRKLAAKAKCQFLKEYYSANWPDPHSAAIDAPYTSIDIETSGLNPQKHEILSIGMVNIENGFIDMRSHYYKLICPSNNKLEDSNISIHQLTEEELSLAEPIELIFDEIVARLQGRIAIVHYGQIERSFFAAAAQKVYGEHFEFPFVDTLAIERRRYPNQFGAEPYRLPTCCKRYGLPNGSLHNAFSDALSTAQLYLAQLSYMERGDKTIKLKNMF